MAQHIRCRFLPNRITVPFEELDGSPEEMDASAWSGVGATRKLKCLSTNRIALVRELLGYSQVVADKILIYAPAPFGIDMPNLIATNVVVKPFGRMAQGADIRYANYDHSVIDVTYEMGQKIESAEYGLVSLRESVRDTTEFVTLPTKGLYWGVGDDKEGIGAFDAPGKLNYGLEWSYMITGASFVPATIFDFVGKLNLYPIDAPGIGRTFPAHTLLYAEPVVEYEWTFGGLVYRITLRFLHKNNGTYDSPKGWNWFPRISASGEDITYEPITDGTDNKNIYASADYRGIFV